MIVPQSISQICSIISSIKLANVKSNQPISNIPCPSANLFSNSNTSSTSLCYSRLTQRQRKLCHKIANKRGFRFDHDNWYVNNGPFFPIEINARRELARIGLISKHHYHPQIIQFDVLYDPRSQANIETKEGRFQLDCNRTFAFQQGSMVYNPRDHERIPNATNNHWANCLGKKPEHEYHVIHTLGWSLQLTNITIFFDVKTENIYYGKILIKSDLERGYRPPNHAIKASVIWEPENHCRIFDVGRSYARMIKFPKTLIY